jgi:glycosyltransferase involved in cell wall biosynthesis
MRAIKVAVLFDSHLPTHGGSYSLIASIVEGFSEAKIHDQFEIELVSVGKIKHDFSTLHFSPSKRPSKFLKKFLTSMSMSARNYWQKKSKLARFLNNNDIDLVFFLGVPVEITNIPFVMTVWDLQHRTHPWFPEIGNEKAWQGREDYYKRNLPRALAIITGTERGKAEIAQFYGVDESNIFLVPHVVSEISVGAVESQKFLKSGPYIYPAQFWAHKNHHLIVQAVKILRDDFGKEIKVNFIGSDKGNQRYIKNLILSNGLNNQIEILGFVSNETKFKLLSESKGLIYPSFSGPENLPPLEAFEVGIPVIYSDFPGAREQLGALPFYFDPNSPLSLVHAIEEVESLNPDELVKRILDQKLFVNSRRPVDYSYAFAKIIEKVGPMLSAWDVRDFKKY